MIQRLRFPFLFAILFLFLGSQKTFAQCFQIESILVDACDTGSDEGFNEMVRFKVGNAALNVSNLTVEWPSNAWQGLVQNASTAAKVATFNAQVDAAGGCTNANLLEPVNGILPANAKVVLITSMNVGVTANVFGAITENIYIIFQNNATTTSGHFANYNATPGVRTLTMNFGACSDTVSYERSLLVNNTGGSGGTAAVQNGATVNFTAAGAPTYVNFGCSAPVDIFTVDAGNSPINACPGATVSLTGTAVGYTTIGWTAVGGTFSAAGSLSTNYTLPANASGSVVVTLTATNVCGSIKTDIVTINIAPTVTPTFTQVQPICQGVTLAALPTQSNNNTPIIGTWSPVINNQATTTYTFTPNAGQCAATATMTIVVNQPVTPTFTQVQPICQGGSLSALPTQSNNTIPINGTWSPALNNQVTTTYTFVPAPNQCGGTATMTITVNPANTIPAFPQPNPICVGGQSPLLATSTNQITGTWSPAFNNQATTTYTFTPNPGQCATTTTLTVTVNPLVTPTFNTVASICQGGNLSALPTQSTNTNPISGTWSPVLNNQATTTYTFTPNAGQCASTTTLTIVVTPGNIVPTFTQVQPICQGGSLSALPTQSNNTTPITGTWSPALNNQATTVYTFTPNSGQCASTTTMTIVVNAPNTLPTFPTVGPVCSGSNINALPTNSSNNIAGTWSPPINNQVTTTYTFTPNAGQCAVNTTLTIVVTPSITPTFNQAAAICLGDPLTALPTTSNNLITGTWSPALNNQVTTTYTFTPNTGGCTTTATMTITVNQPNTIPSFTPVAPVCPGGIMNALPTVSNNSINGSWSPALNNMATTTYTFTPDPGQCATTATLTIVVQQMEITANGSCLNNNFVLRAHVADELFDLSDYDFEWKNSNGTVIGNNDASFNVTTYLNSTPQIEQLPLTFSLTVTSANGCTQTKSFEVEGVYCDIQKGISPNGDGKNEFFDLALMDVKRLTIFNRYGLKVYAKTNYTNQWTGRTDNGTELPDGTYYYTIEFNNSSKPKTGWVYINKQSN